MLSKDIAFRDLGLLIVDEEQRFGVAQKERLKEWKASIDVLSMSATPIPRSLHLSLSGLRDLSIIETPPRDRLAIETQVVPSRPEILREAIEAELARGGQVFFVHNRIESIGRVKQTLEELLPSVRIAVAHGQMPEAELEKAMQRFFSREADVLLATAIVENGLDIPSANTILIDRADTFGLAQLYQLRGRVGRSDKPAYAYLQVEETAALSEIARRRLASIQEFCDLGAVSASRPGPRDPGLWQLLGGEQSGHIAAVGLEMYLGCSRRRYGRCAARSSPERTVTLSLGLDWRFRMAKGDENWRMMIYKKSPGPARRGARRDAARSQTDSVSLLRPSALDRVRARALPRRAARITAVTRQSGRVHVRFARTRRWTPGFSSSCGRPRRELLADRRADVPGPRRRGPPGRAGGPAPRSRAGVAA